MNMLQPKTFIQFFGLDEGANPIPEGGEYMWLVNNQSHVSEKILGWTREKYPNTPDIYRCSFAGLMVYLATGFYSGYGTEKLQKERFAEQKAYIHYRYLQDELKLPEELITKLMVSFVESHLLLKSPLEEGDREKLQEAIELLEASKKSFKSKQVAAARKILEGIKSF